MSLTLAETLRQIDPFVTFSDGSSITTAGNLLSMIDPLDCAEFVLGSDGVGRLIIYRLDDRGYAISPPAFVEYKTPRVQPNVNPQSVQFGTIAHFM